MTVRFTVTAQWDSGYRAQLALTNTGSAPLTAWKLVFKVAGATMTGSDDAVATMSGDTLTATPQLWNGTIRPGDTIPLTFGFNGTPHAPTGCAMDGVPCSMTFNPMKPS